MATTRTRVTSTEDEVEPVRERLLKGALHLLQEEGPGELTVRRISKAAGSTTMCLYTRFGSREGLLDAVYVRGFEQLEQVMQAVDVDVEAEEAVLRLLHCYRTFALDNSALYGVLFERVLPGFDPSPQSRRTALGTTFGLLRTQAGRMLGTDAGSERARELAYVLWAHTHGLVSLELTHSSRSPMPGESFTAEGDGRAVIDAALRATMAGWAAASPARTPPACRPARRAG